MKEEKATNQVKQDILAATIIVGISIVIVLVLSFIPVFESCHETGGAEDTNGDGIIDMFWDGQECEHRNFWGTFF